jgi:hypothetical protein
MGEALIQAEWIGDGHICPGRSVIFSKGGKVMNVQASGQTLAVPRQAFATTGLGIPRSRGVAAGFWIFTALFCLQIGFTAYAQLSLPQVAEAFTHLGFPDYFRVELAWAKLLGVVLLLAPVAPRLKEWTYAGFAITLISALIAHLAVGDGPDAWGWSAGTSVLWVFSYCFWRRRQAIQ